MKKFIHNNFYIAICVLSISVISSACEDGDSYDVSTITYFPSFELTDGETVVINVGDEFVPDATVREGDNELTPDIDSDLDSDVPGIYTVNYSAVNSDGYTGAATQQVIVYDPTIVPTDVRGNIVDTNNSARTGKITLVPGTTNLFLGSDMGFGGVFPLYFQRDGNEMTVVPQTFPSTFGVSSVEASYDPGTKQFTVTIFPQEFAYTFQLTQ